MYIKTLVVGAYETNCYVVADEKTLRCAIIDPGADATVIMNAIEMNHLNCACILLTHGHFDHTGAVEDIMAETGCALYCSQKDDGVSIGSGYYTFHAPEGTHFYNEGDIVAVDGLTFTVVETPGHTPGSVSLICRDEAGSALFCGDTLFKDSCGRTDFPGGSFEQILASLKKLAELPGDYDVYPGHMDGTTLNRERRFNYFVREAMTN